MQVKIAYGRDHLEVDVPPSRLVGVHRQPESPPLADPAAAVRAALERPMGFPALRRLLRRTITLPLCSMNTSLCLRNL
jgi:hypothetical protein